MTLHVATDIGGTFTDLVVVDSETGAVSVGKAPTTPRGLAQGVLDAVAVAGVPLAEVASFVHGTTVVINAITERTGACTALVTTAGFRDVLEIGRGNRPDMYNLRYRKPRPFVPRRHRYEVRERVDRHGTVITPLDLDDVARVAGEIAGEGIEAVAVCFLHAYAHPAHERACAEALARALPGVQVTASSEITGEFREYERTSTTVLNAYVQPVVERYLDTLERALAGGGLAAPLHVMQSNAGTVSASLARRRPITLVESGPAAGIVGAARVGEGMGEPNVLYLDIGGTTAKCSLVEHGRPRTTTEYKLEWRPDSAGYPVLVPVVDIVEIGAGGGSIAWVDEGGALRVGPRSAGAEPGPACYGRGGADATVTDAKLVAGVLDPETFLGGRLPISPELARQALARFGAPLGLSAEEAANGIIRLVNANMISALKLVSVRRGHDPRDFTLVACGGGGPMHAAALGAELRVARVVVPPLPGVFSAWGMLVTEPRVDVSRTRVARWDGSPEEPLAVFAALEGQALELVAGEGLDAGGLVCTRSVDMRYAGQEHAVRVPAADLGTLTERFHREHLRAYGFRLDDTPVELVTFHVAATSPAVRMAAAAPPPAGGAPAPMAMRPVDFDVDGVHDTRVYLRESLPAGFAAEGPLVVEEASSTTLVHPGQALEVDGLGNLVIAV